MTPADLEAFAQVMKRNAVRRVEGTLNPESDAGEEFSIEMDLSAFAPIIVDAPAEVPKDLGAGEPKCACGHLKDSEHHNGLCIVAACPVSVCHPEATAKPPAV